MDTLAFAGISGLALIAARILLLSFVIWNLWPFLKYTLERSWFKVDYDQVDYVRVRLIAAFAAISVIVFTFQASPYLPKTRVVSETSYEAAKAEAERVEEKLLGGVKESEADAKAKERKSDINIREKFEQLPDK
jgi:hypothetical protein